MRTGYICTSPTHTALWRSFGRIKLAQKAAQASGMRSRVNEWVIEKRLMEWE
jgi:hypothetical protein